MKIANGFVEKAQPLPNTALGKAWQSDTISRPLTRRVKRAGDNDQIAFRTQEREFHYAHGLRPARNRRPFLCNRSRRRRNACRSFETL